MVKTKRIVDSNMEAQQPLAKALKKDVNVLNNKHVSLQSMKKPDLVKYCNELKNMYDNLKKEYDVVLKEKDDYILSINSLEDSVKVLELKTRALQEEEKFRYTCGECDFESDCVHCFSDHEHDSEEPIEQEVGLKFNCFYCDETFPSRSNVMIHTKQSHMDKAKLCINFLEGECRYNDRCWFLHDEKLKHSNPTFTCNYCEESFKTKHQLMNHKKSNHVEKVAQCLNETKSCIYGSNKCWFLHTENIKQGYANAKNVKLNSAGKCNIKNTDIQS